jgi:serine/threonine-protein kinase
VKAGDVIADRYEIEELLGVGGMSSVYRALDRVLERQVAVKILNTNLADDPAVRERFTTEAVASARLSHSGIVNVFDTGVEDGVPYIVMELFEGEPLSDVLKREGPLECDRAISILLPVLSALQFAHEQGVIHRDVKPANILVSANGMVKIADFGIARAAYAKSSLTTTGRVLESVLYISPEQLEDGEIDARSDIYSCGAVLYEVLTGRQPFASDSNLGSAMLRLSQDPVPPGALRAGIPRALDALVLKAMARRPEDRFPTAASMAATLARLRMPAAASRTVRHAAAPATPARGWFRSWMLVPLLALVAAAIAIALGLSLGGLEFGGPLGIEPKKQAEQPHQSAIPIQRAEAFDPFGSGGEHSDEVQLAFDGNRSTFWETENYNELNLAPKPGVGLLFDLGSPRQVTGFRLITPTPGYRFQIRVGDDPGSLESKPGQEFTASSDMRESIDPMKGRYVLVWITQVVPTSDGNRGTIAEFKVFGA